jgi:hypothetical protein
LFLSAIRQAHGEAKRVDPNNVKCGKGTDGRFSVNHLTSEAGKLVVQLANPKNRLQRRFKFANPLCIWMPITEDIQTRRD